MRRAWSVPTMQMTPIVQLSYSGVLQIAATRDAISSASSLLTLLIATPDGT